MEIDMIQVLGMTGSILFMFWPLILVAPISRRRNVIPAMLVLWFFMLVVRIAAEVFLDDEQFFSLFGPWYTVAFGITGIVLIGLLLGNRYVSRYRLGRTIDEAADPSDLMQVTPREFEDMAVELFEGMGHSAKRTGRSGDHGVDVVVRTKMGEKWIGQCKRWRGTVGEPVE